MKDQSPLVPTRYFMVGGTFLLAMLVLVDRACISVAKEPMTAALGLTDGQFGWIMSIFALGYALFQAPAGYAADKFGPRKVLTIVVAVWSLFTALTGMVVNFFSLIVVRFLFGMGEAGAFPGIAKMIYSWIPVKERGVVNGINFSGGRLGAAFSLPLLAVLMETYGWRMSFLILGGIGIVWAVIWYLLFRDEPNEHPFTSETEKEEIIANRVIEDSGVNGAPRDQISTSVLLGSKNMWLAAGQYFCSNFTFFFCLTWLFPHLKEQFDLSNVEAGFYASIPLICGAAGNVISGLLVDSIYKRGSWRWSRSAVAIAGFALAAIGLVSSLFMNDILTAIICLSVAVFGADMTLSPSWTFCVDIGKNNSGLVSGTMNMAGNLGSFLTALAFPYLKTWTGSVTPFFYLGAALNVVAILIWLNMKPEEGLKKTFD